MRTVAINAVMARTTVGRLRKRLINRDEPMTRVNEAGVLDTLGAIVPVRAVEAFVANTIDELVTAIADC